MKRNGLLFFIFFCLAAWGLSCKKTDVFEGIDTNTDRIIAEFTDARTGTFIAHEFSTLPIEIDLTELRLDPRSVTDHATRVKIIVNSVAVANYNAANGTTYTAAPTAAFALSPPEYVLKPEQRKVMVKATLRPSSFLDEQYAVGLSIAEMSDGEISKLAKSVVVVISIKNDYDGIYSISGYSNIPGTPYVGNFTVPCSEELEVATSGAASVFIAPTQPVFNAGSFVYISNLLPDLSFDKTTNTVTAVATRPGGLDLIFPYDASYYSRYDPVTKTIYVKYGVAPVGSGRYIIDTLTFCRPR